MFGNLGPNRPPHESWHFTVTASFNVSATAPSYGVAPFIACRCFGAWEEWCDFQFFKPPVTWWNMNNQQKSRSGSSVKISISINISFEAFIFRAFSQGLWIHTITLCPASCTRPFGTSWLTMCLDPRCVHSRFGPKKDMELIMRFVSFI